MSDYDLLVIGAGSGGVRAARMAATVGGQKVAVVEGAALGGTCVNVGCVPKKLFVYASHVAEELHDAGGWGWSVDNAQFNWKTLLKNKNAEITRLNGIYKNLLDNAGVKLIEGFASFSGPNEVSVAGKTYTADKIIVASGSTAFVPKFPGSEHAFTSYEMFYLEELPKKALVVGGGYIAVEFAGILNGLGVEVELVYRGDKFLRGFDEDVRDALHVEMQKKGIKVEFNKNVNSIVKGDNGLSVDFDNNSTDVFDLVLYATGRVPNTDALNLSAANIETTKGGAIVVDDNFKTSSDSVYALGDVINRVQLTPVAIEEAMVLVNHLYGDDKRTMDYDNIPSAVFSQPSFASVGLTETQAREQYTHVDVYKSDFKAMKYVLSENTERVFMKLLVDADTDKVIGVHMMGPEAAEVIQGLAVAVKAGATKADFDATVGIHPSSAEEFVTMREKS